ncbi:phage tail protein [Acinetobacter baumannii]|nr:phage tail protein [Acinetobacter baumannii]EKW0205506.1 phage tail protein [Acinetobacter baumannii]EKW0657383.1 phage tail protein [Acinetobacter baumannii]EKW6290817.1 phage tail protein [Acinetobacter baumannii]ELA9652197.1 phage tail protein [Acinetobacter baumannii]
MAINFFLTDAGRNALNKAGDVASFGGELTHLAVGTGKFDASVEAKNLTSLKNELARFSLNGGGVDTETGTLRFVMSIEPTLTMEVFELGIYLSDGTLLAVASTTEVQSIMSLHANVVAIVTFGFVLTDVNLKNVTIKIDPNTPIAVMLMNQHSADEDPHPQYGALIQEIIKEHLNQNDPHSQYAFRKDVKEKDEDLQRQINGLDTSSQNLSQQLTDLKKYLDSQYPKLLGAGVNIGSKATIDLGGKVTDLRDSKYAIHLTPESMHEAWTITRSEKSFDYEVWNRSGQNRIGYSGIVSWSVIQVAAETLNDGNGDYTVPGVYIIPIQPKEQKEFILVGAGGAGGGSVWELGALAHGTSGTDTRLRLNELDLAVVGGGKGGTSGQWSNGSAFSNGAGGLAGVITVTSNITEISRKLGNAGTAANQTNHKGGASVSPEGNWGAGGDGANGVGDDGWALGGGGASGGLLICRYVNSTEKTQYMTLVVGEPGVATESNGNTGKAGTGGFARVSTVKA